MFAELSASAYSLYHDHLARVSVDNLWHLLFVRLNYLAEGTSVSTRLLNSWGLALQALALLRIRLEETIVCSYLLHEDTERGVEPYMQFIAIKSFASVRTALCDPSLAEHIDSTVNTIAMQSEAAEAQDSFTPGFDIVKDKFVRKWTPLDLGSMATARDKLTAGKHLLSRQKLAADYAAVYKVASSVIHTDGVSISHGFLDVAQCGKKRALVPNRSWSVMSAACNARYDIIQCFEVLTFLGAEAAHDFLQLQRRWQLARDKFVTDV